MKKTHFFFSHSDLVRLKIEILSHVSIDSCVKKNEIVRRSAYLVFINLLRNVEVQIPGIAYICICMHMALMMKILHIKKSTCKVSTGQVLF